MHEQIMNTIGSVHLEETFLKHVSTDSYAIYNIHFFVIRKYTICMIHVTTGNK